MTDQRFLDFGDESLLFWKLRAQLARRIVDQALSTTRLRTITVLALSSMLWGVLYVGFSEGFQLLNMMISHTGTRMQTVHAVYNVFFLTLFTMMTISSGVIVYSTLYRSREVQYLLTTPTSVRRVVLHKFQETVLFAGWGLLLLGTPLLIAFGRQNGAALFYYVSLVPFLISFIVLPVGLGTICCLFVVRFMPKLRMHAALSVGAMIVIGLIGTGVLLLRTTSAVDMLTPEWFYNTLAQLRYSEQRLLPSWWLSTGLLEAAAANGNRALAGKLGFFLRVGVKRNARVPGRRVVWGSPLSTRVQHAIGTGQAKQSRQTAADRQGTLLATFAIAQTTTTDVSQRRDDLSPRSTAMVPGSRFPCAAYDLFFANTKDLLQSLTDQLGRNGQLFESVRDRVHVGNFHHAFYLPANQPRR